MQRRLKMPNAFEFPWVLRAVVPLVRGEGLAGFHARVVYEFVALAGREFTRPGHLFASGCFPRLAAIAGALDDLTKPAAGLRRIEPIRIRRRALYVVHFPAGKVRTADVPLFTLAVRTQNERPFFCSHQYSYAAHAPSFPIPTNYQYCLHDASQSSQCEL